MVKHSILILCLCMTGWATQSGSLTYKAQQLYQANHYHSALRILQEARKASALEANETAEQLILINMAQIACLQYEFTEAQKLLDTIKPQLLKPNKRLHWLLTQLQLNNLQHRDSLSLKLLQEKKAWLQDEDLSTHLLGQVEVWKCIALARSGQNHKVVSCQQQALDHLDDDFPGLMLFAQAQIAEAQNQTQQAIHRYQEALRYSQAGQQNWYSGQILLAMAQLFERQADLEQQKTTLRRALRLFQEMDLDRLFLKAAYPLLQLEPDRNLSLAIRNAESRLSPHAQPLPMDSLTEDQPHVR